MLHDLRLFAASHIQGNDVEFRDDVFVKRYKRLHLPGLWGFLERRIGGSPYERMDREVTKLTVLEDHHINAPRIRRADFRERELHLEIVPDSSQLRSVLANGSVSQDRKLSFVEATFALLKSMHAHHIAHGDALTKNYMLSNGVPFGCDFEHEREFDDALAFDVRLLAADTVYWLGKGSLPEVKRAIRSGYGPIQKVVPLPAERFFFRGRFGSSEEFFDFFYKE